MNVQEIVLEYLQRIGATGLRNDSCGCEAPHLMPCASWLRSCVQAVRKPRGQDCGWCGSAGGCMAPLESEPVKQEGSMSTPTSTRSALDAAEADYNQAMGAAGAAFVRGLEPAVEAYSKAIASAEATYRQAVRPVKAAFELASAEAADAYAKAKAAIKASGGQHVGAP